MWVTDPWAEYERHPAQTGHGHTPKFAAWACDPYVGTGGCTYRYAIVQPYHGAGLRWQRLVVVLPGTSAECVATSHGAFYDGADDHPEGAVEWARAWAMEHRQKST